MLLVEYKMKDNGWVLRLHCWVQGERRWMEDYMVQYRVKCNGCKITWLSTGWNAMVGRLHGSIQDEMQWLEHHMAQYRVKCNGWKITFVWLSIGVTGNGWKIASFWLRTGMKDNGWKITCFWLRTGLKGNGPKFLWLNILYIISYRQIMFGRLHVCVLV